MRLLGVTLVAMSGLGCQRSSPPDIPEYTARPKAVVEEKPLAQVVSETPSETPPEPDPAPPAEPPPPPPKPAPVVEAPKPEAAPGPAAAAAPSIIGTWRVSMALREGGPMPMPEGMEITMTFADDGSVSMSSSGGSVSEAQSRQGSYSLNDTQITISIDNDAKTGTLTFEGNDRAIIEVDVMRMELERV